ncbi:MAG: hypothetical protein MI861_16960 [Pirellulales bacterium]|nr:hypothetical protein [Pirellulales bacterium]
MQISKNEEADLPDVDPPQQRLAVNQPNRQRRASVSREPIEDHNPHVNRLAAHRSSHDGTPRQRPISETINVSLADHQSEPRAPLPQPELDIPEPASPLRRQPGVAAVTDDPIEEMTEEEMTAAFENQPEYVKRIAMQQLIASIKKSAETTSQPAGVDDALQNAFGQLPELPESQGTRPQGPAQRIAAVSGDSPTPAPRSIDPLPAAVPATAPTQSAQPAPQALATAPDSIPVNKAMAEKPVETPVQPAVASSEANQGPVVAQAGLTPGAEQDTSHANPVAQVAALSDDALYHELLNRLAHAPVGESEAARASRLIRHRHLLVLAGKPDEAVETVESMSQPEQEYLRHQLLGLWTMVDPEGHPVPSRRFTTALPELREATKFAAAATDSLEVRSLAFCTSIESYGQIKPFADNRFDAGQQVILYCEVENFHVTESSAGYQTHLQGSYDIYNEDDEKVVSQLLPADKQTTANYLRDYFVAYQMYLPQQLSAGTYRLQLTMEDVSGKKYGQASIPFEIAK